MDELVEEGKLTKGGETAVRVNVSRSLPRDGNKGGLKIWVKTIPAIEQFMQSLGDGSQVDVRTLGRSWFPEKDKVLKVYNMSQPVQSDRSGQSFDLVRAGRSIQTVDANTLCPTINISFLRLVGVSEGAGVSFTVDGVYSEDQCKQIKDDIIGACKALYVKYLKPLNYTVMLVTQEGG